MRTRARRLTRALTLAVSLAVATLASSSASAATPPQGIAPTIVAPFPFIDPQVSPPFLFQWTASAPGKIYAVHVTGRSALAATSLVGVSYEVQISDRIDVASHPLFDVVTDQTSYLFTNQLAQGGFTNQLPPDTALIGGRYYWRVRTLYAGAVGPYSRVGTFRLATRGGGPPLHVLGVVGLRLAGPARADASTLVVARVQNLGTFAEDPATLSIFADGVPLGVAAIPRLGVDEGIDVTVPWTPERPGLANLYTTLAYVDDDSRAHDLSLSALVLESRAVRTRMVGTLTLELGNLTLRDDDGTAVATVVDDRGIPLDLTKFVGKRVSLDGRLSTSGGDFVLAVRSVEVL